MKNMRFVVTGGPGAGKTTVLDKLAQDGFVCVPESARAIIKARRTAGLSPRPSAKRFASETLAMDIDNYRQTVVTNQPVFFDRGLVDALGGMASQGALSEQEVDAYLQQYPLNRRVFILPPWPDIYCTDDERDQTYDESVVVYEKILGWYERHAYLMVEVPRRSVSERAAFMLNHIDSLKNS